KKEYYPVSSPQKRLYLIQQMELNSTAYHIPQLAVLEGRVDKSCWQEAFERLTRRHESLRTSFILVDDEPVQQIHEEVESEIKYYSATEDTENTEGIHDFFTRPFDLSQIPLFRVGLIRLQEQKHLLMLNIHHIIFDKTSMEILITEVIKLYAGERLRPLPLQYKDFSAWQNKWLVSEAIKSQDLYWQKQFSGEIPVTDLPTDYPRPEVQSFAGDTVHFRVPGQQREALKSAALEKGLTMFMVVLGLFDIFLAKISGQEDILVGIPTAGRRHTDLQPIIGMFVNTLVSRNHPAAEKKLDQFLAEVKENTLNAFANQDCQFERLIEKIDLKRDLSRNPLFDVMFSFNTDADIGKVREIIIPGLKLKGFSPDTIPASKAREVKGEKFPYENQTSKFDLTLRVFEEEDEIDFSFEYCRKLFKESTVQRFIAYFKQIVERVIDHYNKGLNLGIADIDIMPGEEKQQLLYDFNDTRASFPLDKTIHQLFSSQVKKNPDHIAVVGSHEANERGCGLMSITYREFNRRADALARVLKSKGVKTNTAVGIMAEPLPAAIIAIMAILKAGGFYLPLDPDQPPQRISYMLADSQIRWLTASSPIQFAGEFIDINNHNHTDHQSDQEQNQEIPTINQGNHFAYMIYTSGTTGKSKGVLLRHINLVNYVCWFQKETRLNPGDRSLLTASLAFDLGYTSIYPCLLCGGQLHLAARETYATASYLLDYIRDHALSYLKLTPSLFSIIAENPGLSSRMLRTLRLVVLGGEEIRTRDVENLHKYCSHIQFINHYGPTEATIGTIAQQIDFSRFNQYRQQPTIGKPISNSRVYILDKQLQLLPIGIPGELFLSGVCLAGGYLNNPELTSARFLFLKYRSYRSDKTYISKKIYRSGDLARWLADGNIEFLGRDDQQVKVRGYRVELGEIENRVKEYPGIKDAAVLVNPDKTGDKYLCAYITPAAPGEPVEIKELMEYLSHLLPGYMIPSAVVQVECIPLTPNGKIDRRALPQPGPGQSQGQYIAPRDEIEEKLAEIWCDLLNRDALQGPAAQPPLKIGIEDNFFQLGGQSLKAALVTARVQKEFHVKMPLSMVFRTPTIKQLAASIRKAKTHRHTAVEPTEKREYYELSPGQKRLYILQQMELGSTAYNNMRILVLEGELERNHLEQVGKELIRRHESLRTSFEMVKGEPVQWIHEFAAVEFRIEYYDLYRTHGTRELAPLFKPVKDFIRPFELSRAPLLRVGLMELEETRFLLVVDMHHIITDAVSRLVFERDFLALCAGRKLAPVKLQYRDYSQWQNHPGQKISLKKQEQYWSSWFAGEIPILNMPTDYPRPPIQRFQGSEIYFEINRELTAKIRTVTTAMDVTMYMVLLAAYHILLSKYTGQDIILVGSPASCRTNADLHQIIGLFANILVMKNMPNRDKSFPQFLAEVKQHALQAFENQDYQFNDLVEKLDIPRTRDRHPLIDTVFAFQDITDSQLGDKSSSLETLGKDNIKVSPYRFHQQAIQHELLLSATERPDNITLMLQYSTVLFKESTALGMSNHYIEILEQITQNPEIILKDIKISTRLAAMSTDSKEEEGDFDF
ncbi:MAG: amino acid adenylation domain-containing protein, partial [Candidatus Aminicenantes bacterium]